MFWKQQNVKFELITTSQKLVVDGLKVKICAIKKDNRRHFMEALCSDQMEIQYHDEHEFQIPDKWCRKYNL